jgi:selenide,water dikinase
VQDEEPKYGLSVIGVIHPDRVLLNRGSRVGDKLILTKPLGTGIVSTALKGGAGIKGIFKKLLQREADKALVARSTVCMTTLNKRAAELMLEMPDIHACTDVTGFGFLGHACEMIEDSDVGMLIHALSVPYFPGLRELVEKKIVPGGLERNRQYRSKLIEVDPSCPDWMVDILFDPQTAGGLLIALPESQAEMLVGRMRSNGIAEAAIVGEIISKPKGKIRVLYP